MRRGQSGRRLCLRLDIAGPHRIDRGLKTPGLGPQLAAQPKKGRRYDESGAQRDAKVARRAGDVEQARTGEQGEQHRKADRHTTSHVASRLRVYKVNVSSLRGCAVTSSAILAGFAFGVTQGDPLGWSLVGLAVGVGAAIYALLVALFAAALLALAMASPSARASPDVIWA